MYAAAAMKKSPALWLLVISSCLGAGCSTTVTNLTPSTQARNAAGLYPFEVMYDTTQQVVRKDSITPYVLIAGQSYPMQPTLDLPNRWETLVPIPGNREFVTYQFKFNYDYNGIPKRQRSSRLSSPYQVQIVDK